MENLSVLMGLFDHLNKHNSKTYIEHFDYETGVVKLSDQIEVNVNQITSENDIKHFLDRNESSK